MDSKCLTTKEVARLCRVSDATVKRWEEAGLVRSERTSGGHRRFRAEEIARFQRSKQLGIKRQYGDESAVTAKTRRKTSREYSECELFHSMVAGQEDEVASILINEYLKGRTIAELFDGSISSTMRRIGELWFEGKLSVAQEHLATRAVICAIHKLRNVVAITDACQKLVICFAVEGDYHDLPTQMVQMTFESEGWEVMNFGANTPLFSVTDEVLHHRPHMICISSTMISDIERVSNDYSEFRKKIGSMNIPVMLGGLAFEDEKLHGRFPADFFPKTFTDVAYIAKENAC